jgi:Cu(I)/Ag(I) efflux system membrane protein CusA/SilA
MIARIVAWSARHHRAVAAATVLLALGGELARRRLPHDAVADLSDPQIVVSAEWMGHPATQVATEVTNVLAAATTGTGGATAVRGSSMAGMGFVNVVFRSADDLGGGRSEIVARLDGARARLPANVRVQVGPEASSTGWVYEYVLADPTHRTEPLKLRHLQDDVLRPALAGVPGVAEVASVGGAVDDLVVEARLDRLQAEGLAVTDLLSALQPASRGGLSPAELEALPIHRPVAVGGEVHVGDVARVRIAGGMPNGLADYDGSLPAVGGIVIARRDADVRGVAARVRQVLEQEQSRLPQGIKAVTVYDRSGMAGRVEDSLLRAIAEEVVAVVLVIVAFLLHGRSAIVPALTLPLVVLLTFAGMWALGIPATVMSLGGIGIALGMAVDAEVVALEACHRSQETAGARLTEDDRRNRLVVAAGLFAPAILTSLVIAALAFLPVFAFSGESGRLLRPLALTKTLVIAAAALVTMTAAPALRDRLLRGRILPELANPLTRSLIGLYRPFVHFALQRPVFTLGTAVLAVASCLPLVPRLGSEFLPRVDEGDLLYMPTTSAGAPPEDAAMQLTRQDRAIAAHQEVAAVFGKVGRADTATDPAPFSMAETTIQLHPRTEWPQRTRARWYSGWAPGPLKGALALLWPERTPITTAELRETLDRETKLPGWTGAWTAPARARMDMMSTGVRTPVGLRIFAATAARLDILGAAVQPVLERVPGATSIVSESRGGETWPTFVPDPEALARFGVSSEQVSSTTAALLTGALLADVDRAGRHERLRLGVDGSPGDLAEQIGEVTVRGNLDGGRTQPVPLALLGRVAFAATPAVLRTEKGELASYVHIDLSPGTDLSAYVRRAQGEMDAAIAAGEVPLRPGERIEWGGQYELLAAGEHRLMTIVPIVVLVMLGLLIAQFRSLAEALIVLSAVPFALVGSVWTLFLLHYPLSAPVWVGLLSVVGLAMQTGVVMVVYIDEAFHRRLRGGLLRSRDDIVAAHAEGTVRRLRPKLMTIATMAAGLLPLLWSDGSGAEIMRRVAAPMLGGLLTSAFLTLEVLPVLYTIWRAWQLRYAERTGIPLDVVVGRASRSASPTRVIAE